MTAYQWTKETHRKRGNNWYLAPPGNCYLGWIASVYVLTAHYPRRRLVCTARYQWTESKGNKPDGWAEFGSVAAAKAWCERQLRQFHDAPEIVA